MAFHCSELPFVFDNTDRLLRHDRRRFRARELGATMSEA